MQILDCVQAMGHINRLPRNEVALLQDQHNVNLFADDHGDDEDRMDGEEEWPEHMSIITSEEFIERYVE